MRLPPPVLVATLLLSACAHRAPPTPAPPPPVAIPFAPSEARCCVAFEQTVVVTTPYGTSTFEVYGETHGDEVVLVALTTYGVRAFSLAHRAAGLEVDAAPMREVAAIPFDRVVRDVYAALLLPPGVRPLDPDVAIEERSEAGSLLAREVTFDARSEHPEHVRVEYGAPGWSTAGSPPATITVSHLEASLRIVVTTRSYSTTP